MIFKIDMPLHVIESNKTNKKTHINLNNYRNWHYQKSNNVKKIYSSIVHNLLQKHKFIRLEKIRIEFLMIRGDKRRVDRSNVLSIHEKFFCDAMTNLGIIKDDNDKHIISTSYSSGEIDKINPRVEIRVFKA